MIFDLLLLLFLDGIDLYLFGCCFVERCVFRVCTHRRDGKLFVSRNSFDERWQNKSLGRLSPDWNEWHVYHMTFAAGQCHSITVWPSRIGRQDWPSLFPPSLSSSFSTGIFQWEERNTPSFLVDRLLSWTLVKRTVSSFNQFNWRLEPCDVFGRVDNNSTIGTLASCLCNASHQHPSTDKNRQTVKKREMKSK